MTFTFKFTLPGEVPGRGYEAHVFDASGNAVGNSFKLRNGDTHSIKAGETIRVYDLKKGGNYSVSGLTTKGEASSGNVLASIVNAVTGSADESVLPAGFSLVRRMVGGEKQSGNRQHHNGFNRCARGRKDSREQHARVHQQIQCQPRKEWPKRQKVLEGRNWADGDTFTVQLQPTTASPMPSGAKSKGGYG